MTFSPVLVINQLFTFHKGHKCVGPLDLNTINIRTSGFCGVLGLVGAVMCTGVKYIFIHCTEVEFTIISLKSIFQQSTH